MELNNVVKGDSLQLIKEVSQNSIHLILSDIPYGICAEDWDILHNNTNSALMGQSPAQKKAGKIFKHRGKPINGWSKADSSIPKEYYEWCRSWGVEWLRVLKPGGSAIVFAGRRYSPRCVVALEDSGFCFRDMLSWIKPTAAYRAQRLSCVFERRQDLSGSEQWGGWRVGNLRPVFEPILWFFKPYQGTIVDNMKANNVGAWNEQAFGKHFSTKDNSIVCGLEDGKRWHPTQKPLKLTEALIELTTIKGQTVLDPFSGSGTTLVAAKRTGRNFLGFEKNEEYVKASIERLEKCDTKV